MSEYALAFKNVYNTCINVWTEVMVVVSSWNEWGSETLGIEQDCGDGEAKRVKQIVHGKQKPALPNR